MFMFAFLYCIYNLYDSIVETFAMLFRCTFFVFKVDPGPYFDSCVRDSCACDTGGDCECFCTAVAAYAKACSAAGACVNWRTPNLCRKFGHYH